jgi:hypothetical protein
MTEGEKPNKSSLYLVSDGDKTEEIEKMMFRDMRSDIELSM